MPPQVKQPEYEVHKQKTLNLFIRQYYLENRHTAYSGRIRNQNMTQVPLIYVHLPLVPRGGSRKCSGCGCGQFDRTRQGSASLAQLECCL